MSPKVERGLYIGQNDRVVVWPNYTGYHCKSCFDWVWTSIDLGWPIEHEDTELFEGAALVAPLSILFWGDE